MEVRVHTTTGGATFELFEAMPETVQVGDTFTVTAGCDKSFGTCKTKFSNGDNFRGFPHIPGRDEIMKRGGE